MDSKWFPLIFAVIGIVLFVIQQCLDTETPGKAGRMRQIAWSLLGMGSIIVANTIFVMEMTTPGLKWGYLAFSGLTALLGLWALIGLTYDMIRSNEGIDPYGLYALTIAISMVATVAIPLIMAIVHIWVPFR